MSARADRAPSAGAAPVARAATGVALSLLLLVTTLGVGTSSARASVAAEQQAGQALAQQVQSGKRSCDSLSKDDLDYIGEFVMGRMIGSTSAHEAMNARMTAVMGAQAESRMHQALGARFVGCATGTTTGGSSSSMMNGQGMMGSGSGSRGRSQGDWNAMMGSGGWRRMMDSGAWDDMMGDSGDWNWMTGSRWKTMSSDDWQNLQRRLLGTATVRTTSGDWHTRDIVLLALVVILAAGLAGAIFAWHPWRRPT